MAIAPKKWNLGVADEAWKVMICARDLKAADEALEVLRMVLTNLDLSPKGQDALIRQMSGDQIMDAMVAYRDGCIDSVAAGIKANSQ